MTRRAARQGLSERRKADRAIMAAEVAALCLAAGAACEVTDFATHVYGDGSRPTERNRIRCEILKGSLSVNLDFDGSRWNTMPDYFCLAWNVATGDREARLSSRFGIVAGASVNPHHRRKCTAFADGFDDLLGALREAFALVDSREAFEHPQHAAA